MAKLRNTAGRVRKWIVNKRFVEALTFAVSFPIISAAVTVHFIHIMTEKGGSHFELAIISATIGGLVMVSGFIGRADNHNSRELINIGKWFLIASVFSTLFGLFMPSLAGIVNTSGSGYYLLFGATVFSLLVATYAFAWAISLLLPKLWSLGKTQS